MLLIFFIGPISLRSNCVIIRSKFIDTMVIDDDGEMFRDVRNKKGLQLMYPDVVNKSTFFAMLVVVVP